MNKTSKNKNRKTIKTYCYGELHEFPSIQAAMNSYLMGMESCEGSERDRYLDIYSKLACGTEPFCDCDGVPATRKTEAKRTLTEDDLKKAQEIVRERREAYATLDALRAKYDLLKAEFEKANADLIASIRETGEKANSLGLELIKYEKRGFRA